MLALSADAAQRRAATTLLAAMMLDLATVAALKALVRRPRPPYNLPDMLVVSVDRYSFPSGHASRSTVLAGLALGCAADLVRSASALPVHAAPDKHTRAKGQAPERWCALGRHSRACRVLSWAAIMPVTCSPVRCLARLS